MYVKDEPNNIKPGLMGVIEDIFVWDNTKGNSYLAIKAKTSHTTGWQLNTCPAKSCSTQPAAWQANSQSSGCCQRKLRQSN